MFDYVFYTLLHFTSAYHTRTALVSDGQHIFRIVCSLSPLLTWRTQKSGVIGLSWVWHERRHGAHEIAYMSRFHEGHHWRIPLAFCFCFMSHSLSFSVSIYSLGLG